MNSGWTILGAGAIGCLWAWHWRQQNIPVQLLVKPERLAPAPLLRYRRHQDSNFQQQTVQIQTSQQLARPIKQLLLTTRADQTLTALEQVQSFLADDCRLVILQNGIAALELRDFTDLPLYAASTRQAAWLAAPLTVVHAASGNTYLGALNKAGRQQLADTLNNFADALPCKTSDSIETQLLRKFAINCAINALTVKFQCRNGELLKNPKAADTLQALCEEISLIMFRKTGDDWFHQLNAHVSQVILDTADNYNSMLQAQRAGKTTELAALNGKLVAIAQALGESCTNNQRLLTELGGTC